MRPVITGWYAEFDALAAAHAPGRPGALRRRAASRFAGATYDPTSHYRAVARRSRFFAERGLTPALLEASYRHQVALLAAEVDALDLPPSRAHPRPRRPARLRSPASSRSSRRHAGDLQRGARGRAAWRPTAAGASSVSGPRRTSRTPSCARPWRVWGRLREEFVPKLQYTAGRA